MIRYLNVKGGNSILFEFTYDDRILIINSWAKSLKQANDMLKTNGSGTNP